MLRIIQKYVISAVIGALVGAMIQPPIERGFDTIFPKESPATAPSIALPPSIQTVATLSPAREEAIPPPPVRPALIPRIENNGDFRTIVMEVNGEGSEYAQVEISVLDAEHHWPIGKADRIIRPGGGEVLFEEFFNSSGIERRLRKAKDIIAIGTASCEMETPGGNGEQREEARAKDRALQLINWLRPLDSLSESTSLYMVNLGRFQDDNCPSNPYETRQQRNAILVSVLYKENIPDSETLGKLIKKAIRQKAVIPHMDRYSKKEFHLEMRT